MRHIIACPRCRAHGVRPTGDYEARASYIALSFECPVCENIFTVGVLKAHATEWRKAFPQTIWTQRQLVQQPDTSADDAR